MEATALKSRLDSQIYQKNYNLRSKPELWRKIHTNWHSLKTKNALFKNELAHCFQMKIRSFHLSLMKSYNHLTRFFLVCWNGMLFGVFGNNLVKIFIRCNLDKYISIRYNLYLIFLTKAEFYRRVQVFT